LCVFSGHIFVDGGIKVFKIGALGVYFYKNLRVAYQQGLYDIGLLGEAGDINSQGDGAQRKDTSLRVAGRITYS